MSKPGLKRYILVYENHQLIAITAERFKIANGVEFYDSQGDCVAVAPSSSLLLVTDDAHLEMMDDLSGAGGEDEDDDLV